MTIEEFKEWLGKRVPPPASAAKWTDSDMHAAFNVGYLAGARTATQRIANKIQKEAFGL